MIVSALTAIPTALNAQESLTIKVFNPGEASLFPVWDLSA